MALRLSADQKKRWVLNAVHAQNQYNTIFRFRFPLQTKMVAKFDIQRLKRNVNSALEFNFSNIFFLELLIFLILRFTSFSMIVLS